MFFVQIKWFEEDGNGDTEWEDVPNLKYKSFDSALKNACKLEAQNGAFCCVRVIDECGVVYNDLGKPVHQTFRREESDD